MVQSAAILLIKSPEMQQDLKSLLRDSYRIIEVSRCIDIPTNLQDLQIGAIIVDIQLIHDNIHDSITNITHLAPNIPIITIIENDESNIMEQIRDAGASDLLLRKYISHELLNRTIEFAIEKNHLQTQLNVLHKQQHYEATHDQLTSLPNRQMFLDRLQHTLEFSQRSELHFAVLYLDIVNFKAVNDTLGHEYGDIILKTVAERLQNNTRKADTVAHLSGDEFAIILNNSKNSDVVAKVTQRLINMLSQPLLLLKEEHYIMINIGIALYPEDGADVDSLMKSADAALAKAKNSGKNNFVFYHQSFNKDKYKRLTLGNQLRSAIEREELCLYYQPQINTTTNTVSSFEALSRWFHAELGYISPLEFIPIAEETDLIIPLGEWALRTALTQLKKFHQAGHPEIKMAVNISAIQFRQASLMDNIIELVKEMDIPPTSLELELTESTLMLNIQESIAILNTLKRTGIKLAIDDFGTGFSSFNYLKKFPIDKLKIDRSFIIDVANKDEDKNIISAIISLAKNLNIDIIAEGVETKEQKQILSELGCNNMQGFYFQKPLEEEKCLTYLEKMNTDT